MPSGAQWAGNATIGASLCVHAPRRLPPSPWAAAAKAVMTDAASKCEPDPFIAFLLVIGKYLAISKYSRLLSHRLHLYQAIVEKRRSSQIGEDIAVGQLVGVLAVTSEFLPPHGQRHHHAATRPIADSRAQFDAAAIVEHSHVAALGDSPGASVVGMDVEPRLAFRGPQTGDIDEAAVEKIASGRGEHRKWPAARELAAGVLQRFDV